MKLLFDSFSYTNRLRSLPPLAKVLFGLFMLLTGYLSQMPVQVAVGIWMSIWIVCYAGIPLGWYLKLLALPAAFLLASLPAVAIEVARLGDAAGALQDSFLVVAFSQWGLFVTPQGLQRVASIMCRSFASISVIYFLLLTIPFTEMLQMARRMKLPGIVVELLLVMYRFVFVLLTVAEQLWIGQKARGGYGGFWSMLKDTARLVVQLFSRTWIRYQQLSIGLAARGFSGELRVFSTRGYTISPRYAAEACVGCILLLVLDWWTRS